MKTIIIASLNGIENSGGLERVTYYIYEMLRPDFRVKIVKKLPISFGKLDFLLQPFILSVRLFFIPNKIVIANSWHAFLFPADLSIHHGTMQGVQTFTDSRSRKSGMIAKMEAISARTAKKVLAVSRNCKKELIGFYSIAEQKIDILNNFVDESIFHPHSGCKTDESCTKILFAGSLCKRKGFQHLVELAKAIEAEQGYELIIASNDKQEAEIFSSLTKTRVVSGLNLNDMPAFYNSGDVLFFPTYYEGFSMSTLEALACGLPVIGTKFAIPDELKDYDFCRDVSNSICNTAEVLREIRTLVAAQSSRRQVIHEVIIDRFGKNQYRQKLLEYVRCFI